ncbi:MAG: lysine--tRNA ligase [Actinobacteria bacterium]|nr:lysine--tRNA ligase [Actinomycetota bacterium]
MSTPAEDEQPAASAPNATPAAAGAEGAAVVSERAHRLQKLAGLREEGIEPYPPRFDRDHTAAQIREKFGDLPAGKGTGETVRVAGRLMLIRRHGGLIFAELHDWTGEVQLMVSRDEVGTQAHDEFKHFDLGDWVGVEGEVVTSEHGELSVRVHKLELLSKALRALPAKGHGLTDVDTRYRERYLDLIVNEPTRRIFAIRSATIAAIRAELLERGFREVETPVLDAHAGGAAARPFITHHNALDIDLYLRIALELPLKRLVVGGMERVFEIGRVFRNEGLDSRHNPEFTLLEAYQAFADYHDMMDLVEALVSRAAHEAHGSTKVKVGDADVDLAPPWRRASMAELIEEHAGVKMHPSMPIAEAREIGDRFDVDYGEDWGAGKIMSEVCDATCEAKLVQPTFVMDHPREVSPLARAHRDDSTLTERFEAVIAGRELANAYSELNDPVDQVQRFEAEAAAKAAGDEEAEQPDDDYVRALEYGLPPTGGLGIGLDRLVMLLAEASAIREVILFPTMRPEGGMVKPRGGPSSVGGAIPSPQELASPQAEDAAARDGAAAHPGSPETGGAQTAKTAERPAPAKGVDPITEASSAPVHALAWLTAILGVICFLPTLPFFHQALGIEPLLGQPGRSASHVASVLAGVGLLLTAHQLARRKRAAWWLALGLFAVAAVAHLLKGPDPITVFLSVGMLLALVWWRREFVAPPDPNSLLALLVFVPLYLGGVLVFGAASLLIESDKLSPSLTFGGIVDTTFGGLVGLNGPYSYESKLFGDFFEAALLALGAAGVALALFLLFRTLAARRAGAADRDRARTLVREYGDDTLAYFALHESKSYFFSSDGRAMIAYAYMNGVALASSDPIGARGSIPLVIDEFVAYSQRRAWKVAFLAVREDTDGVYLDRGFHAVYLGDEAIIRCDRFSINGPRMKAVREAVTRVAKRHRFVLIRESDASPRLVKQLNGISAEWREGEAERGFTMELARDVAGDQPDLLLAVAMSEDDRPAGFLRLVPCYGDNPGYSLDLMRRDPKAVNGLTEALIANAALALGERGFTRLSMNFAAWGRLFDDQRELGLGERALKRVADLLNPFFQIESLRDFNAKLDPEWLPRSIVVEDAADLPRVGVLFATVEGFLDVPVVGKLLVAPVPAEGGA